MSQTARTAQIKDFFDGDSVQYLGERYPTEPKTCDQFSYHTRKHHVLGMLERGGRPGRVLDIGCGPAVLTKDLVERGWKVNGMDLSSGMLSTAARITSGLPRGMARFTAGVGTHLPFRGDLFDSVLCIGVVSYIDDVPALLREVRRVLRPGGRAVFQISNASSVANVDNWLWSHIRRLKARFTDLDSHDRFRNAVSLHWHHPRVFDKWCRQADLVKEESRFYDFRPPLVIDRMSQSLSLSVGRKLEAMGGGAWSAPLASGYLISVSRPGPRK